MRFQNALFKNQSMQRLLCFLILFALFVLPGVLNQHGAVFGQETELEKQIKKNLGKNAAKPPRPAAAKSKNNAKLIKPKKKVFVSRTAKQPPVKVEERQQVIFKTGAVAVEIWSDGRKVGVSDKGAKLIASLTSGEHTIAARKYDQNLFESVKITVSPEQNTFDFSADIARAVDNLRQSTQSDENVNRIEELPPVDANAVLKTYQDPQNTDSITAKDWQAVYRQCRNSVALGNTNNNVEALCLFAQGQIELSLENRQKAISLFGGAISLLPNSPILHYGLGVAHSTAGNVAEATNSFLKVLKLDNKFALAHRELGNIYQTQNKIKEATVYYQQALRLGVNSPDLRLKIAETHIKNKNCSAAIKELEILRRESLSAQGLIALSNCYVEQKRAVSAIEALNKAIELNPNLAVAHYRIGIIYQKQKEFGKAKDSFERASTLDPEGKTINRRELQDFIEKAQKRVGNE